MEGVAHSQSLALQWHRGRARRPRGRGSMQRARAPSSRSPVLNHPTNRLRPCSCAPSCALALSHGNAVCHLHDDLSPPGMKEDNQAPFFPKAVARLPLPLSLSLRQTIVDFCDGKAFLPPSSDQVGPTVQSGVPFGRLRWRWRRGFVCGIPSGTHTKHTRARGRVTRLSVSFWLRGNGELFLLHVRIVICNKTIINADRVS